jgi:outer membrane protein assembly factor BamB
VIEGRCSRQTCSGLTLSTKELLYSFAGAILRLARAVLAVGIIATVSVGVGSCRDPDPREQGVKERWHQQQSGYGNARPAVSGSLVFFGTGDGQLIARDRSNGRAVWTAKVANDAVEGANMVVRNGVVVVSAVHLTVGVHAVSGDVVWGYEAPLDTVGGTSWPGVVARAHLDADANTVYIPAWGASVSAVDILTGTARWTWQPGPSASDTAARGIFASGSQGVRVSGDTVYATAWHFTDVNGLTSEGWLIALDRNTGRELWRIVVPGNSGGAFVRGAPVVSDNLVIFETNGGYEYAFDRFTRELAWEFKPNTQNATLAQTELFDGTVYHDGGDGNIYALRATDGGVVWRSPFGGMTNRDLLVTNRRVYVPAGRTLLVLDRATGRQVARVSQPRTTDSFFASPAAFDNGQVFVTVGDGAWSFDEP